MKNILLAVCLFFAGAAGATVHTVNNNGGSPMFTTIQAAVTAAADGDTIHVMGSNVAYTGFSVIDKKLAFVGPGFAPVKNVPTAATIGGVVELVNTAATGSPTGTEFNGLTFGNVVYASTTSNGGTIGINSLKFIRCHFINSVYFTLGSTGGLFESCIFSYQLLFSSSYNYSNFIFQNNLFYFQTCCIGNQIHGLQNAANILFDHNLFMALGAGSNQIFSGCNSLNLTNNIFNRTNAGPGNTLSTFTNNITNNVSGTNGNTPWLINGNNGTGNLPNTNPQINAQAGVDAGSTNYLLDFEIAAGPANNGGSDGKDIGLLHEPTGSLNFKNARTSRFPVIGEFNILNPNIAPNGTLNVQVKAYRVN